MVVKRDTQLTGIFDDLEVTLTNKGFVVAEETDYYPFGEILSQTRDPDAPVYRFGYQGEFAEEDEETGRNQFELRLYDGVVGRWLSVDPYRQYWSAYVGMGNDPVNGVDPDGGFKYKWQAQIYSLFVANSVVEQAGGEREGEWYVGRYDTYNGPEGGTAFKRIFESNFDIQFKSEFTMQGNFGNMKYKDTGIKGYHIDLGSLELFRFKSTYSKGLFGSFDESKSEWRDITMSEHPFYWNVGGSYESGVFDIKGKVNVETPKNIYGPPKITGGSVGIGAPFIEGKISVQNGRIHRTTGIQEDWAQNLGPLGLKLNAFIGIDIIYEY